MQRFNPLPGYARTEWPERPEPVVEFGLPDHGKLDKVVAATLDIPKARLGRIIGKNGETINALENYSAARIRVDQTIEPARVTISGTPPALSLALSMVSDIAQGTFRGFAILRQFAKPSGVRPMTRERPLYSPGYGLKFSSQETASAESILGAGLFGAASSPLQMPTGQDDILASLRVLTGQAGEQDGLSALQQMGDWNQFAQLLSTSTPAGQSGTDGISAYEHGTDPFFTAARASVPDLQASLTAISAPMSVQPALGAMGGPVNPPVSSPPVVHFGLVPKTGSGSSPNLTALALQHAQTITFNPCAGSGFGIFVAKSLSHSNFHTLYSGVSMDTGRPYLLKCYSSYSENSTPASSWNPMKKLVEKMWNTEVSILQRTTPHPNIVHLIDHGYVDETPAILLEPCGPMGTAVDLYQQAGPLPEPLAKMIIKGVAAGLQHLHVLGVVHGELRASNLLMGADGQPKLSDFGGSKSVGSPVVSSDDQQADIWSLGCLFLELLCGRVAVPYAKEVTDMINSIGSIGVDLSSGPLYSHISTAAKQFILECLVLEPPTSDQVAQHPYLEH